MLIKADADISQSGSQRVSNFSLDVYEDKISLLPLGVLHEDEADEVVGPVINIDLEAWNEIVAKVNQKFGRV